MEGLAPQERQGKAERGELDTLEELSKVAVTFFF